MTPNPPTPTPVSQGDREVGIKILEELFASEGAPYTPDHLIANYRAACVAKELADKDTEIARLRAKVNKYWVQICNTVEAMGKVSPEAAPYSVDWAKHLRAELTSLKQSILDLSHPNLRMLMADRDRAIAKLAKCKDDGARLDWLEKHGADIHISCWKGPGAESNPWTIHTDFENDVKLGEADTLRETIDAASAV